MRLKIIRETPIGDAIPGTWFINEKQAAYSLERVGVEIPTGTFEVNWYKSPKFGHYMPHIEIPNRTVIEIHWGNETKDTDGCPLIGSERSVDKKSLINSRLAYLPILMALNDASIDKEEVTLTVESE